MSDYADEGVLVSNEGPDNIEQTWRDHISQARNSRRRLEPTWLSNLAFAAGRHWFLWNDQAQRLQVPQQLQGKDLYTADVISEYRMTALGDLATEDDRPELLLVGDDDTWNEEFQKALNRAIEHGWDHEWKADSVLAEVDRLTIDLGTAAVQCRWDPDAGGARRGADGSAYQAPFLGGKPMLDAEQARVHVARMAETGQQADIRTLANGKICWEPLSAFNLLPPPGIPHENDFPWEIVVRPTLLEDVQAEYPAAASLSEDGDIGSVLGLDESMSQYEAAPEVGQRGVYERLRGHVWLFSCYQRPTKRLPGGRTIVLAGASRKLLRVKGGLPYEGPDGDPRSGVAYFHWQRVSGRFFSRSLVEALKDPQRIINRRKTQIIEIVDRGMPFVLVQEGSINKRTGVPMEKVELSKGSTPPVVNQGVGPGAWMEGTIASAREDLAHASGFRGVTLGENPSGVSTYSQLALLNENDRVKRQPIGLDRAAAITRLIEDSVYDMRSYWGSSRKILFAGDEDLRVQGTVFDATKIPAFFIVKAAKGAVQPRGQAAQLKLIEDIFTAALNSQQPLPISWLKESYEAGQPLPLPTTPNSSQQDKADLENRVMEEAGQPLHVAYYDPIAVHLQSHRNAQVKAEVAGDMRTWEALEAHIQEHLRAQAENAQRIAQSGEGAFAPSAMVAPGQSGNGSGAGPLNHPFPTEELGGPGLDIRPGWSQTRYH